MIFLLQLTVSRSVATSIIRHYLQEGVSVLNSFFFFLFEYDTLF